MVPSSPFALCGRYTRQNVRRRSAQTESEQHKMRKRREAKREIGRAEERGREKEREPHHASRPRFSDAILPLFLAAVSPKSASADWPDSSTAATSSGSRAWRVGMVKPQRVNLCAKTIENQINDARFRPKQFFFFLRNGQSRCAAWMAAAASPMSFLLIFLLPYTYVWLSHFLLRFGFAFPQGHRFPLFFPSLISQEVAPPPSLFLCTDQAQGLPEPRIECPHLQKLQHGNIDGALCADAYRTK